MNSNLGQVQEYGYGVDMAAQNRVLRNTYALLSIALLPMIAGAYIGTHLSFSFLRTNPILGMIGLMAVLYGLMFAIERFRNSGTGVVLLLVFTAVLGVITGPLLQVALSLRNGAGLIGYAVGGTALIFFVMAAIGTATKKPMEGLGKFLAVGGIVLMIAVVANIFLQMPIFSLVISSLFMLFSSLVIMWQLNQIVSGGETNYISATLTLVVSIYNLFTSLLQILLSLAGERD